MQGIQESAVFNEFLEIMNVNHTCTYQRHEPHIQYMQEGGGEVMGSKSHASPCGTVGDEICECSDQWTQSKQLYVHLYEFHSKNPSKTVEMWCTQLHCYFGSTCALESGVGSS